MRYGEVPREPNATAARLLTCEDFIDPSIVFITFQRMWTVQGRDRDPEAALRLLPPSFYSCLNDHEASVSIYQGMLQVLLIITPL